MNQEKSAQRKKQVVGTHQVWRGGAAQECHPRVLQQAGTTEELSPDPVGTNTCPRRLWMGSRDAFHMASLSSYHTEVVRGERDARTSVQPCLGAPAAPIRMQPLEGSSTSQPAARHQLMLQHLQLPELHSAQAMAPSGQPHSLCSLSMPQDTASLHRAAPEVSLSTAGLSLQPDLGYNQTWRSKSLWDPSRCSPTQPQPSLVQTVPKAPSQPPAELVELQWHLTRTASPP